MQCFLFTYTFIASCFVVPNILGNNLILDGTLSPEEWNQASSYDLEYEVMPSRNTPAALKTTAFVKYDKKYLNLQRMPKVVGNLQEQLSLRMAQLFL